MCVCVCICIFLYAYCACCSLSTSKFIVCTNSIFTISMKQSKNMNFAWHMFVKVSNSMTELKFIVWMCIWYFVFVLHTYSYSNISFIMESRFKQNVWNALLSYIMAHFDFKWHIKWHWCILLHVSYHFVPFFLIIFFFVNSISFIW